MTDASGAIRFALSQLGKPYLWGATGPDSYDCSGLLQTAYQKGSGLSIPRTTYDMLSDSSLMTVNQNQLQPGDLVFPSTEHVQMYLGGGKVVEAPHSGVPVRVTTLGNFYAGRRVTSPANGDWSVGSPVSDASQITSSGAIGSSDIAQGLGSGITTTFSSVFQTIAQWTIYLGSTGIGFALILLGFYFVGGNQLLKGIPS